MIGNYAVLHSIPGRTRLSIDIGDITPAEAEARLRMIPGVYSAVYSSITKTAVLHHLDTRLHGYKRYLASLFPNRKDHDKVQDTGMLFKSFGLFSVMANKYPNIIRHKYGVNK